MRGAAIAVVLSVLLAACGLPETLAGEDSQEGAGDRPREIPTALHPGLRDCAPAGSDDALALSDTDLDAVQWSTPDGFVDVTGEYFEDNPVEDLQWMWVGGSEELPPATLDVISVNYYEGVSWHEFADDCDSVPLTAVNERLAQYRTHIGAQELTEAKMIEIDGYPAMSQDLRLATYDYEGYWLFSTTQLLHVYCQWESASAEAIIRQGCAELVDSLVIP